MISVFRNVMDTSDSKCRYKIWFRRVGAIMYVSLNGSVNKFHFFDSMYILDKLSVESSAMYTYVYIDEHTVV